ncbi:unnamed protein product [Albugo candida]|uniref:Uncharacterized protein n=1 Tax=Albugo candida TaxID=65357 RepID=A0A024FX35_9STRA|nr:unnamed protein product [Albugo candida]|eukprot:CCI11224.1 unnamed protein product [Albugo candida]
MPSSDVRISTHMLSSVYPASFISFYSASMVCIHRPGRSTTQVINIKRPLDCHMSTTVIMLLFDARNTLANGIENEICRKRRQGTLCCLEKYVRTDLNCGIDFCQQHTDCNTNNTSDDVTYLIPDAISLYPCLRLLQNASEHPITTAFFQLQTFLKDKNTEESRFISFAANENYAHVSENWESDLHETLTERENGFIGGTLHW